MRAQPSCLRLLGQRLHGVGDRDRGERAFETAVAMKSRDSRTHFNLGLTYAATGRNTQAVQEFQAALTADPHNAAILAALERLRH